MRRLTPRWLPAIIVLTTACASNDPARVAPPTDLPRYAMTTTSSGITIAAIRTGWVGVKEAHWRYSPPGFLVIPRIFLSRRWHEWIPNISFVVEVDGRTLLVDAGSDPAINDPSYMECDPNARFFYRHNMRFIAELGDTVDHQLPALGIPTDEVETIVITHFHGDHPGRIGAFPRAKVLTGAGNWPTHVGSVPCTLPEGFAPELARFEDGRFGVFAASEKLLGRDDVRLIPLPGHTPGHVGVLVKDGSRYWLIAGDATFNREETDGLHVCGVSEDVEAARETQRIIKRQLATHATVLLPAHDPEAFTRLAQ
jgi:glyoxylase-like metal-dependent hydrolase (beta-lactamase superfamily II)